MSIKSQGGVFGRNPTFRNVEVEGNLTVDGTLTIGGSVITGLNYQGAWDASTNTPDLTVLSPPSGQFWIVSADGNTNLGGITNWTSGDWALYDGANWQRVEGGNTDLDTGVSGTLKILNGGTGANDAATARQNLGLEIGVDVEGVDATILRSADIGSTVQGYDVDIAKYDDSTANFTGTLQSGGNNVLTAASDYLDSSDIGSTVEAYDATILKSADIGSTVQAYDADTAKLDVAQTFTAQQTHSEVIKVDNATTSGMYNYISAALRGGIYSNGTQTGVFSYAGNPVIIAQGNGGTELARFDNGGISFNGDTAAANFLDDYEEGTWTPTDASGAGLTFTNTSGNCFYTKIGRTVVAPFRLTYPSTGSGSAARIDGLPFNGLTSTDSSQGAFFVYQDYSSEAMMRVIPNTNDAKIVTLSGDSTNANVSGKTFAGVFVYLTS